MLCGSILLGVCETFDDIVFACPRSARLGAVAEMLDWQEQSYSKRIAAVESRLKDLAGGALAAPAAAAGVTEGSVSSDELAKVQDALSLLRKECGEMKEQMGQLRAAPAPAPEREVAGLMFDSSEEEVAEMGEEEGGIFSPVPPQGGEEEVAAEEEEEKEGGDIFGADEEEEEEGEASLGGLFGGEEEPIEERLAAVEATLASVEKRVSSMERVPHRGGDGGGDGDISPRRRAQTAHNRPTQDLTILIPGVEQGKTKEVRTCACRSQKLTASTPVTVTAASTASSRSPAPVTQYPRTW